LKKYVPDASAELLFQEGFNALASADPDLKYSVSIEEHSVLLTIRSRSGEPIKAAFQPHFPDTEEGHKKAQEFARFLSEGSSVSLDATNLDIEDLPHPLKRAIRDHGNEFVLNLGPRRPRNFTLSIRFRAIDGSEFEFPYVEFGTNRFEGEAVVLSNEQQRLPFKLEERLYPDGRANMQWSWNLEGKSFYWLREILRFQGVVSQSTEVIFRDLDDGIEHRAGRLNSQAEKIAIDPDLVNRVVNIQLRTKTPITIPTRPYFTENDLRALEFIESVIETGREPSPRKSIVITMTGPEGVNDLRKVIAEGGPFGVIVPMQIGHLLDTPIRLGPVEISFKSVAVDPDDAARFAALFDGTPQTFPLSIRFIPRDGDVIETKYSSWAKPDVESASVPVSPRAHTDESAAVEEQDA